MVSFQRCCQIEDLAENLGKKELLISFHKIHILVNCSVFQENSIYVLPCNACFICQFSLSLCKNTALPVVLNQFYRDSFFEICNTSFLGKNTKTVLTFFRSQVLGSDGDSLLEIDSSPGYSQSAMDLFKACESSQEDTEDTEIAEGGFLKVQQASYVGPFYGFYCSLYSRESKKCLLFLEEHMYCDGLFAFKLNCTR